jgi:hypothetical protein
MGRPPLGDRAMTAAERMRRHRARKKQTLPEPEPEPDFGLSKDMARSIGYSVRTWYTIKQYERHAAFRWDNDIFGGKYGRCGWSFIADVCKHGDAGTQRLIHDMIKQDGAAHARAVWKLTKQNALET